MRLPELHLPLGELLDTGFRSSLRLGKLAHPPCQLAHALLESALRLPELHLPLGDLLHTGFRSSLRLGKLANASLRSSLRLGKIRDRRFHP